MNKKYTLLFVAIFCVGLLCAGGTYAYWSWNSNTNKTVGFNTVAGVEQFIVYNSGYSHFIGDFKPATNYCGGASNTISFKKNTNNVDLVATINMQVNEIEANTKASNSVYWVVTSGTTTDCTGVLSDALGYGTFTNKGNGSIISMVDNITVTTTEQTYTVWIWINSSGSNLSSLSGETINTNIWTQFDMVDLED